MITITYPPGGGGRWLTKLVAHLIENRPWDTGIRKNFHGYFPPPGTVALTHDLAPGNFLFTGGYSFNIFLNQVFKSEQFASIKKDKDRINTYAEVTDYILHLTKLSPDINYNLIFDDRAEFIKSLYSVLDRNQIEFIACDETCTSAIKSYKQSCIQPIEYFDNWENEVWLGWCNGILKHYNETWYSDLTIDEIKNKLHDRRNFFKNYTETKVKYDIT